MASAPSSHTTKTFGDFVALSSGRIYEGRKSPVCTVDRTITPPINPQMDYTPKIYRVKLQTICKHSYPA